MSEAEKLLEAAAAGRRLKKAQALALYLEAPLHDLARAAHEARLAHHPEPVVTYVVDRNVNYSNVCVCGCRFCAFFRPPGSPEGYLLGREELARKIEETLSLGGTQILLQGSHHPDLDLRYYEDLLAFIKSSYPTLHLHAFSPPEIVHFSRVSGIPAASVLERLIDAGLDSIPGGGAEILSDRVRREISPHKCTAGQWLEVMRTAHELGLPTTATMMFGHVETLEERIDHLLALRELQDRTGGFTAFIPWPFQPDHTRIEVRKTCSIEYLRLLAAARLVLDNIPNLQASWVTMGPQIGQLALFFGANDFGSTMIEENVVAASGVCFRLGREEIEKNIRDAGFVPKQRLMDYRPA
jgi:cyclic dehypoxanthinyl futalosine synthase